MCVCVCAGFVRRCSDPLLTLSPIVFFPQPRLFSAHLEEETGGRVQLKRLDHSNPQFVRCQKAVVENAKKDFFHPRGRYQGASTPQ